MVPVPHPPLPLLFAVLRVKFLGLQLSFSAQRQEDNKHRSSSGTSALETAPSDAPADVGRSNIHTRRRPAPHRSPPPKKRAVPCKRKRRVHRRTARPIPVNSLQLPLSEQREPPQAIQRNFPTQSHSKEFLYTNETGSKEFVCTNQSDSEEFLTRISGPPKPFFLGGGVTQKQAKVVLLWFCYAATWPVPRWVWRTHFKCGQGCG